MGDGRVGDNDHRERHMGRSLLYSYIGEPGLGMGCRSSCLPPPMSPARPRCGSGSPIHDGNDPRSFDPLPVQGRNSVSSAYVSLMHSELVEMALN
jgi:hypothetical protein